MTDADELLGRRLADRYRIRALIARGGMARVYRARDERLERDVAIKVLSAPYAADRSYVERFLGEARNAASVTHPSLVHVYDSGTDGDAHYIVMELLEGHTTLRERIEDRGRLPATEVVRIGRELLAGLSAVHERGLVHCDVKAANVMLGPGSAKLIDFGIATPPHGGIEGDTSIGSLHAMSPEQLHGRALTPASDLFSLGVVMYQALTGRVPYPGETPAEVSAAQRAGTVRPPSSLTGDAPSRLDDVIMQALRPEAGQRFHSAGAMAAALEAAVAGDSESGDEEETRVIAVPAAGPRASAPAPSPNRAPASRRPPAQSGRRLRSGSGLAGLIGTLLVLGAAAAVVLLVVVPLLQLGEGGPAQSTSPTAAATPQDPNLVVVPNFVGRATGDAIDLANELDLDWTVRCAHDETKPPGIVDQEPQAGAEVRRGAPISLYSARIADCG